MGSPREVVSSLARECNRRDATASAQLYDTFASLQFIATGEVIGGREAIEKYLIGFFVAFPDHRIEIEDLIEDGDRAVMTWERSGTWREPFLGIPPNGRLITIRGCGWFRVFKGKIKFQRDYWDRVSWYSQLGIDFDQKLAEPYAAAVTAANS